MSSIFTEIIQTIHYAEDIQLLNPDVLASKLYVNNPQSGPEAVKTSGLEARQGPVWEWVGDPD